MYSAQRDNGSGLISATRAPQNVTALRQMTRPRRMDSKIYERCIQHVEHNEFLLPFYIKNL
jgi:hypothetical protein